MPYIAGKILLVIAVVTFFGHKFFNRGNQKPIVFVLQQTVVGFNHAMASFGEKSDLAAAPDGQRQFVAVAENFVAGHDFADLDRIEPARFFERVRHESALETQLRGVIFVLNIAPAAFAERGTGRRDAGGRGDEHFFEYRHVEARFYQYDLCPHLFAGERAAYKHGFAVRPGDSFAVHTLTGHGKFYYVVFSDFVHL